MVFPFQSFDEHLTRRIFFSISTNVEQAVIGGKYFKGIAERGVPQGVPLTVQLFRKYRIREIRASASTTVELAQNSELV